MGVDLRIIGTRRRLTEHGDRQSVGVGMATLVVVADPSGRPEPLKVRQRRRDGDIVCFEVAAVAGQRPQHAQRLGCRERGVEPGDRLHHPTIGDLAILQRVAELCPRDWVAARQQSFQRRSFDGAGQAEAGCLVSRPHSRHLARGARQIAGVVRRRRCRRRGVDRGHPQHQTRHPIARSGTCLQNQIGRTPTTILNISMLSPSGAAGATRRKHRDDRRSGRQKQPPQVQPSANNALISPLSRSRS